MLAPLPARERSRSREESFTRAALPGAVPAVALALAASCVPALIVIAVRMIGG